MVLINKKIKFIVYELDTQKSAINRLAAELKTLPNYLYFPSGIPTLNEFHNERGDIVVEDLLKKLSIGDESDKNFVVNLEEIKTKIAQQKLNMILDILPPYIAYNKMLAEIPEDYQQVYSLIFQEKLDKSDLFEKPQNIYNIWEKREEIKMSFDTQIKNNAKSSKTYIDLFKQYYSIKKGVSYTPFELERVNFEFTLDMSNIYIIEIFNQIQLNSYVPFACINNTFKILKDFIPPTEWSIYLESAIVFKVLQKVELESHKDSDFIDVILSSSNTIEGEEQINVGMSLDTTTGQNLTREKLIERLFDTIKGLGKIKIKSIKENWVNGIFFIPNQSMNKYVLADLVMNNSIFSSLMTIDESEKASKRKDSVYIYFKHPLIGEVRANITQKNVEKGEPSLKGKNMNDDFIVGSSYIRVKISSANNVEAVSVFQEIISKLFIIYDKEYKEIVDFYTFYIPNFIQYNYIQKPITINNLKLKDIAPEVFLKGYPPKCPHQPSIIEDDEIEEAKAAGKIVMTYPQTKDEGFLMRNYICNHKTAIYPGLRDNPLNNRDLVPYLPCCYTKPHEDKKGSIYRHYYYGEELRLKLNAYQQDFIITNKFVPKDKYGTLPDDITKLFEIFDQQEGYMYVRKGVENNKSSFLNCVMEGMHEETNILQYQDEDERESQLYQTREKMATLAYAASCRQEMYDFTIDEIISAIKNPSVNLEPKLFVALLENFFNCNIFVFNRTNNRNGQLSLPRHLQTYYKTKRKAKSIFIYEHIGSTSDNSDYKRCELIVRWKIGGGGENDVTYSSPYDSKVSKGIQSVFNSMHKSYALNIEIPETEFPINNQKIKLIEQGIDSYGKSRMIRFKYKGALATLLTTPIQPLAIPEIEKWIVTKLTQKTAMNLCKDLNIVLTGQSISRDIVKELYGILGNVRISIPIEDSIPDADIPGLDQGVSYTESNISIIDNYNKYKKLSRYITEYMYWLFSTYIHKNKLTDKLEEKDELNTIKNFIKTNLTIDPDFEYSNVEKSFNLKSGVMKDKKLVVKSEETLKRLVYTLRLSLLRFRKKIMDYHTRKVIENYYVDVSDFDQYQFQVILQGDNSVDKWIQEQKTKYFLYDSVQPQLITPYFFKNDLVDDKIYLAQNTDNIGKAMNIYNMWKKFNWNVGNDLITSNQLDRFLTFSLFRYINSTDIKKYKVGGLSTIYDIKILGYKIEEKSFYTVLLDLKNSNIT